MYAPGRHVLVRSRAHYYYSRRIRLWTRSSSASSSSTITTDTTTLSDSQRQLAQAALLQVPHHGWTQDAITAAVLEHSDTMSLSMSGMFTPTQLLHWVMDDWNQQLLSHKKLPSVRDKIRWRLEQVIPLVESGQWHQGMALGLTTPMVTQSQLHDLIEAIAPPGSSTWSKTGLGSIFVATELHLLADTSENYQDTWTFLEARLQDWEQGGGPITTEITSSVPMAATAAVAKSLCEGVASLLLPPTTSSSSSSHPVGTRSSDYAPKK